MGRKNRNSNIKILQRQIQDLVIKNESIKDEEKGGGTIATPLARHSKVPKTIELKIVELDTKPKKKGIPKDALINTRRLLTM